MERELLNEDGVRVTTSKLVVRGRVYAVPNITSVWMKGEGRPLLVPIVLTALSVPAFGCAGFFLLPTLFSALAPEGGVEAAIGSAVCMVAPPTLIGAAMVGLAGFIFMIRPPSYVIFVATGGSARPALRLEDRDQAERVLAAIEQALS